METREWPVRRYVMHIDDCEFYREFPRISVVDIKLCYFLIRTSDLIANVLVSEWHVDCAPFC